MLKGYLASVLPSSLSEAYAQWCQITPANRERAEYWLHMRLLPHLLALCADAVQRRDRDALGMWLQPPPELARAYRLLGAPLAARVQHLLQVALDALYVDAMPAEPADAELVAYFRTGRWRPARRAVRLTVALADPDAPERAVALTLLLERVAPTGAPYPHPAMHWRLFWDEAFQRAIDHAGLDGVRWSLSPLPPDAEIAGDSLGGALALGARLLETCPGDHRRYAILCRYDPDTERLLPVEQFQEKYDAVRAVRRVRTVLVSDAQLSEPLPHIAPVDTLTDALRLVRRQRRRARLMRSSLALPILPLVALLWGLQQGSYTLELTPSGRIMLYGGLIRRAPIDTGYFALEIAPERLPTGRRWRWRTQPAEYDPAPYREIADALLDPLAQATLRYDLGDTAQALQILERARAPFPAFEFRRLETLAQLQPARRAEWLQRARRLPAPDPESQLARARLLHRLGALPQGAYLHQLKQLARSNAPSHVRLDALEIIARDDPDWILRSRELRQLVVNASLVRAQRAYGLRVLARLSQTRLYETVPLIEPYRNDPLVQSSRAQIELLIQIVLRRDETFYRQQREPVVDIYMTDAVEAEAIELVFQGLLEDFARRRPTLADRWAFLLGDLETPFADRWAAHHNTLMRTLLAITPPTQRDALRAVLLQRLAQPLPTHRRLTLQRALRLLNLPDS
jgi:hypothetical protein